MTAEQFWDKQAPGYAAKPIANPAAYESTLRDVRSRLRSQDRVLELGCGTGSTALLLAPGVSSIVATDSSPGMMQIARAKLESDDAPTNVSFVTQRADAPVDGAPFEAVLAFSLLHLVSDLPGVLASVHSQLRPGGLFLSKTVCLKHRSPLLGLFVRALTWLGIAPPVARLGRDELVHALDRAGFDVEHSAYFDAKRMNPYLVARRR